MLRIRQLFLLLLLLIMNFPAISQLRLGHLFTDHMVLQREQPVNIWGWAKNGATVTVLLNKQTYTALTGNDGEWKITMPAMNAGGPHKITVTAGEEMITLSDVLFGDVWLCSGQSNMEWRVADANNATSEIAQANDDKIRHFKVPHSFAESPEPELAGGEWTVTGPATVGDFTAVGYFFARELRKYQDVPIGLLNSSWGGSRIEAWMSAKTLGLENPNNVIAEAKAKAQEEFQKTTDVLKAKFPDVSNEERGIQNGQAGWATETLDDTGWALIPVPALWEQAGYEGFDGIAWYRTTFELTTSEASQPAELGLGKIDDSDLVWVNGKKVGGLEQAWNEHRIYQIDPSHLKPGRNSIAVRVEDTGGGGGIHGGEALLYLKTTAGQISLTGNWKFKLDAFLESDYTLNAHHTPTLLYNKMIYPILPFSIKGALWYQGESNAGTGTDAVRYRNQFAAMISDWRTAWGSGDFPFLYVQLANFRAAKPMPSESNWALLRESQTEALKVKNTGQAVIIDIGEANDIHPRNKQDVGLRLSLAARKIAYNEDIIYSGPVYKNHAIKGNKVIVNFDHIGEALVVKNKYGYVNGFVIAGADKKFFWAKALIENGQVVVWSENVSAPIYIRYAWAANPDDVNLYNAAGLPACPFRTDD